jgi:hypothetical protein
MENTKMKKLFYNFKDKKFIVKDLNFDMHDKEAWISFEENPSRKDDCYFLEEMSLKVCGKFADYVKEKERIGRRDPSLPDLATVLKYFKEWKESKREGAK